MTAPHKRLGLVRTDNYDPRHRPWFRNAVTTGKESWSAVYTDFTTLEPTFTLTKPIYRKDGTLIGVAATDMSLAQLTNFFKSLEISKNGIAFIVERSGAVIATSTNELPYRLEKNALVRLMADQSASPLLREAYTNVLRWQQDGASLDHPLSREFNSKSGIVQTILRTSDAPHYTQLPDVL